MIIKAGTQVDIRILILPRGQRAPQVPEDTAATDLIMKVKGRLLDDTPEGSEGEIITPVGRRLRGIVLQSWPPYTHGFGPPIRELWEIGSELRELLRQVPDIRPQRDPETSTKYASDDRQGGSPEVQP